VWGRILAGGRMMQRQYGFILSEEKSVAHAVSEKLYCGIGLSLVGFEDKWKMAEGCHNLLLAESGSCSGIAGCDAVYVKAQREPAEQ
jgi:hypothetical protein